MRYSLFVPKQAVGASLIYFDLWNPGGGVIVSVEAVTPMVSGAVAVTGLLGVDLYLQRTTAIGTGGTAAVTESATQTAMTFAMVDNTQPLSTGWLSARLTPSGGATAGAILEWTSVFTEEAGGAAYNAYANMIDSPVLVPAGSGLSIVQGVVASVGNIGFNVLVNLTLK